MSTRTEVTAVVVVLALGAAGGIYRHVSNDPELPPPDYYTSPPETGDPSNPTATSPTPEPSPDPTPVEGTYLPDRWTSDVARLVVRGSATEIDCLDRYAAREARSFALQASVEDPFCSRGYGAIINTATKIFPIPKSGRATDLDPAEVERALRRDINPHIDRVGVAAFAYDGQVYVAVIGALS